MTAFLIFNRANRLRGVALCFCAFFYLLSGVSAQLNVALSLDKKEYLLYEPIRAKVTIHNRSGQDVILNTNNKQSWLAFRISNPQGQMIAAVRGAKKQPPILLKQGEIREEIVVVTADYPISKFGYHGLTATVYFPPNKQYFSSARVKANITDGKVFWEETVGVPQGLAGAGEYRRYSLLIFRDAQRAQLYFRLHNEGTGSPMGTRPLGRILDFRDPQASVDQKNNLHVLFMTLPRTYLHISIAPDGRTLKREVYQEEGINRPNMMMSKVGEVKIHGGEFIDPNQKAEEEQAQEKIKSLSTRPNF